VVRRGDLALSDAQDKAMRPHGYRAASAQNRSAVVEVQVEVVGYAGDFEQSYFARASRLAA
jgi:hypothetical protein